MLGKTGVVLQIREKKVPKAPVKDPKAGTKKEKKSLVSMLKRIDGKLLDVLRKNSALLKKQELKAIKSDKAADDGGHMIPKGLSSRKFKRANKSADCKTSRKKTPVKNEQFQKTTSYVQLDLSKNTMKDRRGFFLAQHYNRSPVVCPVADGSGCQTQRTKPKPRASFSSSLSSLKRIGRVDTLKNMSVDLKNCLPPKPDGKKTNLCHYSR